VLDQLTIREAGPPDLDAMNALMHASSAYHGAYYRIIENVRLSGTYLAGSKVFVCVRAAETLGFYSLILDDHADLDLMFVADVAQRLGVGRALFDHMKALARANGYDSVEIGAHPPAVGFYQRMGAVVCGVSAPIEGVTWERPLLKLSLAEA